jgi:hypothetical protein
MASYRELLLGAWRLVSFEVRRADGEVYFPMGQGLVGLLLYLPDGHMSVQLMSPDRPQFQTPAYGAGTDADWARAARGYFAYAGRFTVDEARPAVTHHVEMALNSYWSGRPQTRAIRIDGDLLELSGPSPARTGEIDTAHVRWRRAS